MSEKKQKRKDTFLLHSLLMKAILERKTERGREGEKEKKGRDKLHIHREETIPKDQDDTS